jgi:hypothetical protein
MHTLRLAVAAAVTTAAIGAASPAQAADCDTRLDRLVQQFYDQADRHGYEEATEWWQARWHAYHQSCVLH